MGEKLGKQGYLILNTGHVLTGKWFGADTPCQGEMVFTTGMTGYQEVMSDPSFAGQIVTFTYPLIGNYGINDMDFESVRPVLAGLIIAELCVTPSHYQSVHPLAEMAEQYGIPGLYHVDTRALTQIIREHGEVYGSITTDPEEAKKKSVSFSRRTDMVASVSCKEKQEFAGAGSHMVLIDLGHKKSIRQSLTDMGCRVTVVPYNTTLEEIDQLRPDGVVISNGPGDPKDLQHILPNIRKVTEAYPTLGICLGHQVIVLAHGGDTERLPFGHRGCNHPVKQMEDGKVFITAQNHGYVVIDESLNKAEWAVTYRNVNDDSVEGLKHCHRPITTIQFHPEAHPGPEDTWHIFTQFIRDCSAIGEKSYA